ncbi:MAG: helix-turn-helix domain-containing protein, partial [Nitrospirota bacterium]
QPVRVSRSSTTFLQPFIGSSVRFLSHVICPVEGGPSRSATMTQARVLQEVRQMRFEELSARRPRRDVTMAEAAEMLGVTERTFRRWSGRSHAEGAEGLQARRIGRLSARAVPVDEALWRGRRPIGTCPSRSSPRLTRGVWCERRNRAPPSSRGSARPSPMCGGGTTSGSWPSTTSCTIRAYACRARRTRTGFMR